MRVRETIIDIHSASGGIREGDIVRMSGKVARVVKVNSETMITIKWITWYMRLWSWIWRWVLSMRRLFIDPWIPKKLRTKLSGKSDLVS